MTTTTKPLKVLVVDDDQFQLMAVSTWLKSAGMEVLVRNSPFGTSREVLREQPDVLLLDINMPGLDGIALLDALGKRRDHIAIIFYSGEQEATLYKLVAEHHALGAISKERRGKVFLEEFAALCRRWQARRIP